MKKSIRARYRIAQYNDNICSALELSISLSLKRCEDISKEIIKSTDNGEKKELNNSLEEIETILVSQQESYKLWVEQKNHEELKIYPWEHIMRYDRGVDDVKTSMHIVAFIDILGFKHLLDASEFNRIYSFFQQVADETMYLRRHYNLLSCSEIMPKMDNFSDSIILSTKIYSGEKKYNQVNSLIFDIFSQLCRTLIAVGLRMGIALRGFIKIGEYFNDVASSVEFKSVSRWGEGRNVEIFKAMWQEAGLVFPQEEKPKNNEQLPQIRIPVHFGDALTKAYLSESKIKNIGIFMSKDVSDKYYIKKQVEEENILAINKGEYFALNWCREVHYDVYMEIMKYIESCLLEHKDSEYVLEKWKNLYSYAKYAPTK